MKALIISLKLETPVLITGIGNGEENSSLSLPYIPGGALRGALIGRYRGAHKGDLLRDETAVRLFFSDEVSFLNAYPKINNHRALPVPASWRQQKDARTEDETDVRDFAITPNDDFDESIKQPFCVINENGASTYRPVQRLSTHISGQERGIVRQENNTVFQYQALAEGQVFISAVLTENEDDRNAIKDLITQDPVLYLGRSRSARYGRVHASVQEDDEWAEAKQRELKGKTIITLLSDAILRDAQGQPTYDLDAWLTERLRKGTIKSDQRFIKSTLVGGFNRKWGLPLPQMPALGMGSVFVYNSEHLSPQALNDLVKSGIGERRVEGFGRIAVNWQGEAKFQAKPYEPATSVVGTLSSSSQEMARAMAERILRQRLDAYLSEKANKHKITGNINNHQLARLRNVLRDVLNAGGQDMEKVQEFLENLKPTAQKQYQRAKVEITKSPVRLNRWLDDRLKKKDALSGFSSRRIPKIAGQKAELTDALKTEYTLRLIEAVVSKKMKENRRANQ